MLNKVGISLRGMDGQMRDTGDVLAEVGSKWNTYNKNQQSQISTAIAG